MNKKAAVKTGILLILIVLGILSTGNIFAGKDELIAEKNVLMNEITAAGYSYLLNSSLRVSSVFIENYSCSSIGQHTVKVLTTGKHKQSFDFNGQSAYAENFAIAGGDFYYHHTSQSDFENGTFVNTTTNSSGMAFIQTYGEIGVDDNMVLYLKFNNDSGYENYNDGEYLTNVSNGSSFTIHDYSNYGNNGTTFPNQTKWTAGHVGNALSFDGVNDYVNVNNNHIGNSTGNEFSISGWFNFRESGSFDQDVFYLKNSTSSVNMGLYLFEWTGVLRLGHDNDWSLIATAVSTNKWYFFNINYNGSTVELYLNRSLIGTAEFNDSFGGDIEFYVGWYATKYMRGLLDEVRIYNRTLNATEINWSYLRGSSGLASNVSSDGLVLYLPFNESSGDKAVDYSNTTGGAITSVNNGTLTNYASPIVYNASGGRFGGVFEFDGVDDYVEISVSNTTTIAYWKKNSSDSVWHYVVNSSGTTYFDGVVNNTVRMYVNASVIGKDSAGNFFNGSIDQVIIWNKTLKEHELRASYLAGVAERNLTYEWLSPVLDSGEQGSVNWTKIYWGAEALYGQEISSSNSGLEALIHLNNNCDDSSANNCQCTSYGISYTSDSKFGSYAGVFGGNSYMEVEID